MELKKLASATALAFLLTAGAAAAQTTATDTSATSSAGTGATVGTPNTGSGGEMAFNAIALMTTGAIAIGGAALLARRRMI